MFLRRDHVLLDAFHGTTLPYLLATRTRFIGFGGFDIIDSKAIWSLRIDEIFLEMRRQASSISSNSKINTQQRLISNRSSRIQPRYCSEIYRTLHLRSPANSMPRHRLVDLAWPHAEKQRAERSDHQTESTIVSSCRTIETFKHRRHLRNIKTQGLASPTRTRAQITVTGLGGYYTHCRLSTSQSSRHQVFLRICRSRLFPPPNNPTPFSFGQCDP
jgi:hypothetical protein